MHTATNEQREPVHQVASRLRSYEDYNLAARLQDEEFGRHYALNRTERRRMSSDIRQSRHEQAMEDRIAAQRLAEQNKRTAQVDEALARRLQLEFEREDYLKRESQARLDAELARRLQLDEEMQRQQATHARLEADDERLARQLQRQLDGQLQHQPNGDHQRTGPVHRIETSAKKVLPILASVKPKIRIGGWRSPMERLRSNSEKNVDHLTDTQWFDRIDERSQNELNQQMATASGIAMEPDEPSRRIASAHAAPPSRKRTPLATLATREQCHAVSSVQRPSQLCSQPQTHSGCPQQQAICVHGSHVGADCRTKNTQGISSSSAFEAPLSTKLPVLADGNMQVPQQTSIYDDDLIQLSPALIASGHQVSERIQMLGGGQHSSAFAHNEISFGEGFPGSQHISVAVPIVSDVAPRSTTVGYLQMVGSRPQVSFASEEVPSSLIGAETTAPTFLSCQAMASPISLPQPIVPERVGSVPLPVPPTTLPKPAVGASVKAAIRLLQNQCSFPSKPPPAPPLAVDKYAHDGNGSSDSGSLCNDVLLQSTQPPSNMAKLHPTNPFLSDLQTTSPNEPAASPLSYGGTMQSAKTLITSRAANESAHLLPPPSALAMGLDEESKIGKQPVGTMHQY